MLAIVSPHTDIETIQLLLANHADQKVVERGTENNLFHLAANLCTNDEIFFYLLKNLQIDIFARNKAGETCMSICLQKDNNKARIDLVE